MTTACFIADPLMHALPNNLREQFLIKARTAVCQMPPADKYTTVGNNQLGTIAWELIGDLTPNNNPWSQIKSPHPIGIGYRSVNVRQFTPLFLKLGANKWDASSRTHVTTVTPGIVYMSGNKDQLLNANALNDAWTRAFSNKQWAPDYVICLDPWDRMSLQPNPAVPLNNIPVNVLHRAATECNMRGIPFHVLTL